MASIDESNSLATNGSTLETDHATDYQMGSRHDPEKKRGHCLILNYQDKRINGSEEDVQTLSAIFRLLNFDVSVHQNLTKPQTEEILISESEFDHERYHCFVLCILSQGSVGKFQCSNSQDFEYENVFDYLEDARSLKGKPKLYFIDAPCSSEQTANQGSIGTFGGANLVPLPDNLFTKPLKSHSFAFYSSSSRHFGEESPLKGSSWFVQDLCTVLNQFADKGDDLYEMASKVNKKLANRESKGEGQMASNSNVKQISRYLSTLTKDVRF